MYNLTNDARRVTVDIDLDLVKIYLADENVYEIFKHSKVKGIKFEIDVVKITDLKHQDYKGKRVPLTIRDNYENVLSTKIDVGVNIDYDIAQSELSFVSCVQKDNISLMANSKEQIFAEKLIPILKFGLLSTRYKGFYDLYWLIKKGNLDKEKTLKIINKKVLYEGINNITKLEDVILLIKTMLNDDNYRIGLMNRKNNWLEIDAKELCTVIISYLDSLVTVEI